jgi:hypothetical protein
MEMAEEASLRRTGLSSFTRQKADTAIAPQNVARKRGKGDTVAITVRLTREQWERLHQFAISEGDSLQGLALRGLSTLLHDKGLGDL